MPPIRFGLTIPADQLDPTQGTAYVANLNRALHLATGSFDSAWIIDHLQFGSSDVLESFTTLAYMAAQHPQLKFGHAVICQSFRNPALLAKMGATLQFISGGRFLLGIGAGWHAEEYRAYGYDFPSAGTRVAQLEETLQIIRSMWTQKTTTFAGAHYRVNDAYCEPKPDPLPPVMVGAFQPKMLRLAARYADDWNVSSSGLPRYRRLAAQFESACAAVGRDPRTVRRSWCGGCAYAATQAEAEQLAGERFSAANPEDDFGFVGTPAQVAGQLRDFITLGVDTFILDCAGFPSLATLERLIGEVIPLFNA
jgi:alkanesulfonate monooxygenase SsuD/methylene tetrahydromethanopterin reductase-like flavin-dependent oxidoreductase (luciferase family)